MASINLNQKGIERLVEEKVQSYKQQCDELTLSYEEAQNNIAELKFAVQSYQSTLLSEQANSQLHIN